MAIAYKRKMAIFDDSILKNMDYVEIIGYLAAVITTAGFVPQTVKTLKTRKTKDISLWTYLILVVGVSLWFAYGLLSHSWPIIFANGVTLLLVIPVLVLKLMYK